MPSVSVSLANVPLSPVYFLAKLLQSEYVARATWVRSGFPSLAWEGRWNLTFNGKGGG